jgi:NAD(P)-dependent dehydrogenase (short-subunit alcohol dehydrogenase family)
VPGHPVSARHLSTAAQFSALRADELDVGLVREHPIGPDLDAVPAVDEPLAVLLAAGVASERAGPDGIRLEALAGLDWVGFPRSGSPAWFDQLDRRGRLRRGVPGERPGAVLPRRRLAPAMAERGHGAIVNVSTMVAEFGMAGMGLYGSSKAALELLTKSWAAEFGPRGVRGQRGQPRPGRPAPRHRRRSPTPSCTWPPTSPASSTARSSPSTAAASRSDLAQGILGNCYGRRASAVRE